MYSRKMMDGDPNGNPNEIKMEDGLMEVSSVTAANLLNHHFDATSAKLQHPSISPPTMVNLHHHHHPHHPNNHHTVVAVASSNPHHSSSASLHATIASVAAGAGIVSPSASSYRSNSSSSKQRWNESPEARARRLARNAERMRERRARESEDEYRKRLARNAEANRMRRQNENEVERAMRLVRNAARQRLRRAMETPDQRAKRLAKLAERMRLYRAMETTEQRKERLAAMAQRARDRIARENSEERRERLRKLSDYAKRVRANKKGGSNGTRSNSSNQQQNQQQQQSSGDDQVTTTTTSQQPNSNISQSNPQQSNYPHQTLTNSIEYYQNMFINSALRPTIQKESQTAQIQNVPNATTILHGALQNTAVRFVQQPNTQNITTIEAPSNTQIFQTYDNKAATIQKLQPYQTLTSSIEFYQNKFIKTKSDPNIDDNNIKPSTTPITVTVDNNSAGGSNNNARAITTSTVKKATIIEPHLQNPPASLYNQFPYLNSFPAAAAAVATSNTTNQQNYYPVYHNGLQLSIAPNSVPPPFTPVHFQNATASATATTVQPQTIHYPGILNATTTATTATGTATPNQSTPQDFPRPVRGRPKKIFPDSDDDTNRMPVDVQEEALRQQKVNALLENEINQMLTGPRRYRARPGRSQHESEEERRTRLQKISEHQKQVRANESPDQRAKRLQKLSERARLKRQQVRETESEEQRKERLAKQAQYARQRRLKAQTPEHKKRMEDRAKELYAQLHGIPLSAVAEHQQQAAQAAAAAQQQQQQQQLAAAAAAASGTSSTSTAGGTGQQGMVIVNSDDFIVLKNPGKDFHIQTEHNDVHKILEPIFVMRSK